MIYSESSDEVISQIKMIELTQKFGIPLSKFIYNVFPVN